MQWWGNFGSAAAGIAALIGVVVGISRIPKLIRVALEQAEVRRAERRRDLSGWSTTGIGTFNVALVTSEAERDAALRAVSNGGQTEYVILRMLGGPRSVELLRQLLDEDPYLARRPTRGECEALKIGLEAMDIPLAAYEQVRRQRDEPAA